MKYYEDCEKEIGQRPQHITWDWKYYAYKNGEVKIFDSEKEAKTFSYHIERFCANQEEINKRRDEINDYDEKVYTVWWNSVRNEYSHLSDKIFDVLLSKAYELGHSEGYDSVAYYMIDCHQFYYDIKNAEK